VTFRRKTLIRMPLSQIVVPGHSEERHCNKMPFCKRTLGRIVHTSVILTSVIGLIHILLLVILMKDIVMKV
jgi:hypothetical protein